VRIAVDSNVLVTAHAPSVPRHQLAREFLREQLRISDVTLVVTSLVLQEFVHVVSDPRRFEPVVPMSEALALANGYLGRTNVQCLAVDDSACRLAFQLLERHGLGRNRIADCLLAATLLEQGVHRLATFDVRDFALFAPLRASEPVQT
jgi:predicted nucleic acid-binding protein